MSNFHVGQKVVCVDADIRGRKYEAAEKYPQAGAVYTVRQIDATKPGLRLVEIVNPALPYNEGVSECWFSNHRFRPAVTRKTDISIFKAMLTPQKPRTNA